jgi:menaquinone-dependent protoporphyrinogen oxidase
MRSWTSAFDDREEATVMSERVLVAYATWHGSTQGVAEKVAELMRERGASVDVMRVQDIEDISEYAAVVVGSAIRMGSMNRAARAFFSCHAPALASKKIALFLVCLTASKDDEQSHGELGQMVERAKAAASGVTFVEVATFAGGYDRSRAGLLVRFMFWAMRQPPADFRDWDAITTWAARAADALGIAG